MHQSKMECWEDNLIHIARSTSLDPQSAPYVLYIYCIYCIYTYCILYMTDVLFTKLR